ncbi:TMV resistance protein N-like [Lycium ferocissimum]|uniref:TMV resistance protein N-like n=1 Tax=Lycium ferocissimum TaxID=112874 RepID=UPI002815A2A7|nr:TMV resistance protein N-like [Lycium ferocissimum]
MDFTMGGFLQALDDSHHEEKLDKVDIVSQNWLMNQAQQLGVYGDHREGISRMMEEFLKIHVGQSQEVKLLEIAIQKLEAELNAKIEACDAQYQRVMECNFEMVSIEEEVMIDFQELMVNCQPTNLKIMQDAEIEELILELHKKVHEMVFENSSSFFGKDAQDEANLEFGRIGSHSNHFSTLCLVDDMVELTEPMEDCGDEEEESHFPCLRKLISLILNLMRTPDFREMPNLEYLDMSFCTNLEEVDDSLGYCGKLIRLDLGYCSSLKRFPCVNLESLEYLGLMFCYSLEKFPEIKGRRKLGLEIHMDYFGIREIPSSFFQSGAHLTKLDLSFMKNLVALPRGIGMLKSLVELDVSYFSSLEILPEEIGDLENLERLDARYTLISRPPSSIARLNKLKSLSFEKSKLESLQDGVCFVFPQVNGGLHSLEYLDLSYCNLIDGGLPEDIGSLSSLKELNLRGNNFEHLPQSIAQLGALQSLHLSDCKRLKELPAQLGALRILDVSGCFQLTQLPEFVQQLDRIDADWSNDWICNSLFQNISSLQHDFSASHSLLLRVFTSRWRAIPSWLHHQGMDTTVIPSWFHHQGMDTSVSVNLSENCAYAEEFMRKLPQFDQQLVKQRHETEDVEEMYTLQI